MNQKYFTKVQLFLFSPPFFRHLCELLIDKYRFTCQFYPRNRRVRPNLSDHFEYPLKR